MDFDPLMVQENLILDRALSLEDESTRKAAPFVINPLSLPAKTGILMGSSQNIQIIKMVADLSPLKQTNLDVASTDVSCKEGLQLMIHLETDDSACVLKESSIDRLKIQGWAISSNHAEELERIR